MKNYLKKVSSLADQHISKFVSTNIDNHFLKEMIEWSLSSKGKMLRPGLAVLGYEIVGGKNRRDIIGAATAMELLHTWTLVHDDIIDKSDTRRGIESLQSKYGPDNALLAGDALLILAESIFLYGLECCGFSKKVIFKSLKIFKEASLKAISGELSDMKFDKEESVSVNQYINMLSEKTSALMSASLALGATLAGASDEDVQSLITFGYHFGVAFQLHDDVLDVIGDSNIMGKQRGGDIFNKKKTLLYLWLLDTCIGQEKREVYNLFNKETINTNDVIWVIKKMKDKGAVSFVKDEIKHHYGLAVESLRGFSSNKQEYRILLEILNYAITRNK